MTILVASPVHSDALAALRAEHHVTLAVGAGARELQALAADRNVLVFRSGVAVDRPLLDAAPELRLLIRAGSGLDNVDLETAAARGIELVRIPQPGARAVAELTFALMLALARGLLPADRAWRQARWVKHEIQGWLLHDKILGILGAGSIGAEVGRLGAAWGMRPIGCVQRPSPAARARLAACGIRLAPFGDVVASADFLTLHVPLTPATRGLVDARVLAAMKPGAFLVNVARGGVVDEAALLDALRAGHLRGAALDVHAAEGEGHLSPLAGEPNVVLTPHIGSTTVDTQREIGRRIVEAVADFARRHAAASEESARGEGPAIRASLPPSSLLPPHHAVSRPHGVPASRPPVGISPDSAAAV